MTQTGNDQQRVAIDAALAELFPEWEGDQRFHIATVCAAALRPLPATDATDCGNVGWCNAEGRCTRHGVSQPAATDAVREDFLAQLRRVNAERYEAWVTNPIMLCAHCGADASSTSPNCAPPFAGQPHSFTKPHPYLTTRNDAGIMFDAVELGGEVGELLNVVKKLEREDRGWRGSRADPADFADECADVLICLDKLARRRNVDLQAAVIAKFNATSDKVGLPHKLAALPPPATRAEPSEEGAREAPELLTEDEVKALLSDAEALWRDLQENQLGGFSGINRPFYILWQFKEVIEKYGRRDVGLRWSKDDLDALAQQTDSGQGEGGNG